MNTTAKLVLAAALLASMTHGTESQLASIVTKKELAAVQSTLAYNKLLRNNSVIEVTSPKYERGALIQVMNFLRYPLVMGSATATFGQVATEMAQVIRPGSFEHFWVTANGEERDSGHCQGAGQFRIGGGTCTVQKIMFNFYTISICNFAYFWQMRSKTWSCTSCGPSPTTLTSGAPSRRSESDQKSSSATRVRTRRCTTTARSGSTAQARSRSRLFSGRAVSSSWGTATKSSNISRR